MNDDKSDQKQKEWERLETMIAEAKRYQEIANAQKEFESLQRRLKRSRNKNDLKPRSKPKQLVEQVMIERGLLVVKKKEVDH